MGIGADRYLTELPSRPDLGKYPHSTGVFDTLARMNERFEIEPSLAERWTYASESNTYRFELRKGVLFHDGAEFTADDVKYTFDLVVKAYPDNYQALGPGSIRVRDRYLVEMTPTKSNHRLVEQLAHPVWGINRVSSDPMKPIGTGPFRFIEYLRHDRFVVERFPDHWNVNARAHAARVVFHFIPDPQARALALEGLSFLGLGAQPPTPEWGTMINEGRNLLFTSPHVMLFPGAAVTITVVGFNLVGEALYEAVGVDAVRTPWL